MWHLMQFESNDGEEIYTEYAVIHKDGLPAFIIGEIHEVEALRDALSSLLSGKRKPETVHRFDERLGYRWLTVSEAAAAHDVAASTVRRNAAEGKIDGAKKQGRDWRFPERAFLSWLKFKYQPENSPK